MTNRYICTILTEMRNCDSTRNYSYILGLIEEAQSAANRMESALEDYGDIGYVTEELSKLKKELRVLKKEKLEVIKEGGDEINTEDK